MLFFLQKITLSVKCKIELNGFFKMNSVLNSPPDSPSRVDVGTMFDALASRYDRINQLISLGVDRYWRRQLTLHVPRGRPIDLLDVATGTGRQLIEIMERVPEVKSALGIDLSPCMIEVGNKRLTRKPYAHRATLALGDAIAIALKDNTVDCVTIAFGIRNVLCPKTFLREAYRVVKKEGRLIVLEFSLPTRRWLRACHLIYLRHFLPRIGALLSKHKQAYRYLNQTIETFPYGAPFCRLIEQAGFQQVRFFPLTFGIATLYIGEK